MSIAKKFSIYSLILIFLTGAVTWLVVQKVVTDQVFHEYEQDAMMAQSYFAHHLIPSDFEAGNDRLAGVTFREAMARSTPARHFDVIKVLRPDGRILYSNVGSQIGKQTADKKVLSSILSGQVVSKVIKPRDSDDKAFAPGKGRVPYLLIDAPIKLGGEVVGILETSCDLTKVYERTEQINTYVVAVLCASLVVLWFALSRIVAQAARTVDIQNTDLRRLADERADSLGELEDNYLGTLRALAVAVEDRCSYTSGHSQRTRYLSLAIARRLGLREEDLAILGPAAILHDIGKIGTPETIMEKAGALTTDEWEKVKQHPVVGAQIVSAVTLLANLAPIIRGHHENFDGTGYPDGFTGEQIPLAARILAVADAFDAITSNRPYREGISIEDALVRLKQNSGGRYDPAVVSAFIGLCRDDFSGRGDIRRLYGPQYAEPRLASI